MTREEEEGPQRAEHSHVRSCALSNLCVLSPVKVHLNVSTKEVKVSNIPASCSEGRLEDRLEISLSRPSRGGGEVDSLVYDRETGTAHVTFLNPGGESQSVSNLWTSLFKCVF